MAKASTSTYAVLGLLSLSPMSGYEVAQATEGSIAHFWPISKTHVYSELSRIERLGWADSKGVRQRAAPDKRVFQITPSGEQALDAWLVAGSLPDEVHRLPFLIKLFIGHRIPAENLRSMLREYREEAEEYCELLRGIVDALEGEPKAAYPRATALLGLRMSEAALRWSDEVEGTLPRRRVVIDPRSRSVKARELFEATPPVPPARSRRSPPAPDRGSGERRRRRPT